MLILEKVLWREFYIYKYTHIYINIYAVCIVYIV